MPADCLYEASAGICKAGERHMKVEYFTAVLLCFALTLSACEINKNHLDAAETRYDITDAGSDTVQAEKSNDSAEPHYDFNTDETGGYKPNNIEIGISACKVEDFIIM